MFLIFALLIFSTCFNQNCWLVPCVYCIIFFQRIV
nr:MAG TPA: hypothetical protein [Caudoviricetes sp.]